MSFSALFRRVVVLCLVLLSVGLSHTLSAQRSHGYTFHTLADSTSVASNGSPLNGGGPSDSLNFIASSTNAYFMPNVPAANNPTCGAWTIYSTPINGGAISPLVTPATKVEPAEPDGTINTICSHPTFWGDNLVYGAFYGGTTSIPTLRSGFFRIPAQGGGASADVIATGDSSYSPYGPVLSVPNGSRLPVFPPVTLSLITLNTYAQNTHLRTVVAAQNSSGYATTTEDGFYDSVHGYYFAQQSFLPGGYRRCSGYQIQ